MANGFQVQDLSIKNYIHAIFIFCRQHAWPETLSGGAVCFRHLAVIWRWRNTHYTSLLKAFQQCHRLLAMTWIHQYVSVIRKIKLLHWNMASLWPKLCEWGSTPIFYRLIYLPTFFFNSCMCSCTNVFMFLLIYVLIYFCFALFCCCCCCFCCIFCFKNRSELVFTCTLHHWQYTFMLYTFLKIQLDTWY